LVLLDARGLHPDHEQLRRIEEERDLQVLDRWLAAVGNCADVAGLLSS
jgi:hypothetical protein